MRKYIPLAESPFEHVLLVAGNGPARCIDLVWVILGFDPFGFRVAHDWNGGSFALGVVNGVLKNSGVSAAVPLVAPDDLLCHPTEIRSCLEPAHPGQSGPNAQEMISRRSAALKQAEYLVDMQAPEALRYNLVQSALCDPPDQRNVGTQILKRLQGWYQRTINETELRRAVADVIRQNTRGELKDALQQRIVEESATGVNWPVCLSIYQTCLAKLRDRLGLPVNVEAQTKEVRLA
jgi:hypothetical protein